MSKLIIMQGLPASGKSTLAEQLAKEQGAVRINKDLLRTMLHFDRFTGKNEEKTRQAARLLAGHFLKEGNVIIDDTNLNPKTVQSWVDLAKEHKSKIEYQRLDTPVAECVRRDWEREKRVGTAVIVGMALQWGRYPKPEKGIVICDLDGTLCDIHHRLHHVKGERKDWKAFFAGIPDDLLRQDVAGTLEGYAAEGHEIFLVSARPDTYRKQTANWLAENLPEKVTASVKALFMRPGGDSRPDTETKAEMYDRYFKDMPIEAVIDDRPSVIRMWREKGLNVIDVGQGVDF